jgi:hypothetical protein
VACNMRKVLRSAIVRKSGMSRLVPTISMINRKASLAQATSHPRAAAFPLTNAPS